MKEDINLKERTAQILLASVIFARSTSYVLAKSSLDALGPFNLLGLRFTLAFIIMVLIFPKRFFKSNKQSYLGGIYSGLMILLVMVLEVFSLKTCPSSTTALLENTAIVIIPLIQAIIVRKLPSFKIVISVAMAAAGVVLMSGATSENGFGFGHFLALLSAFGYALYVLITAKVSKSEEQDPLVIGMMQLGTMGILGLIASFIFESPIIPSSPATLGSIVMLAVVCSCFGFTLQPVAQRYVSVEVAGIFTAISPLGAGILGWIFLGEALSGPAMLGVVLILASIVITQLQIGGKRN